MRPMTPMMEGLIVDNFAGGGGASSGIEEAFGRPVDIAINHDPEAVAMHMANHPQTLHLCQSVWKADPREVVDGRPVALAWFSPDCKHFSKAKGGKPVEKNIRDLAWVVVHWSRRLGPELRPRVIMLENVEEFRTWDEIDVETGMPVRRRECDGQLSLLQDPPVLRKGKRRRIKPEGKTFQLWKAALKKDGYRIEHRELRGCDFGEPTIRKRLFVIARCDGRPIVWPEATHGPGRLPYRTAASDVIDWSIPCRSIFNRKKPLAENTLRRIAHGVMKFVVNASDPFILRVAHGEVDARGKRRGQGTHSTHEPLGTAPASGEFALVTPFLDRQFGKSAPDAATDPVATTTERAKTALIAPTMIQTGYGERPGQAPRVLDIHKPYGTCVDGAKAAVVSAFIAKHTSSGIGSPANEPAPTVTANGGINDHPGGATPLGVAAVHLAQFSETREGRSLNPGHPAGEPVSTIVQRGPLQAVVASHLVKLRGTCRHGQPIDEPAATASAQGMHIGQVVTHLAPHVQTMRNAEQPYQGGDEPTHTVTAGGAGMYMVAAFLAKYFGTATGQAADEGLHTVTALPRFGLVTVTIAGEEFVIVDIGMRMLTPRELARAQGFRDDYVLDPVCDRVMKGGKIKRGPLPIASQIRMIGNSVNRRVARALVAANCNAPLEQRQEARAA